MSEDPNKLIDERLKNIEKRIIRLAFLLGHLKKFKEDKESTKNPSKTIEGVSLFYYYSFSQFILEIFKLFDNDTDEYYTIPKLLNHIESNIRHVNWYKSKVTYPKPTKEQYEFGKVIWSKGEKIEWYVKATGAELSAQKQMVRDLKMRITKNQKDLEKIKLARDKVIAHLDKDFLNHNFNIKLEMAEKLLRLSLEIFNALNLKLKGSSLSIDQIDSGTFSTLVPILKYYELRKKVILTKKTKKTTIEIEELNKIIN